MRNPASDHELLARLPLGSCPLAYLRYTAVDDAADIRVKRFQLAYGCFMHFLDVMLDYRMAVKYAYEGRHGSAAAIVVLPVLSALAAFLYRRYTWRRVEATDLEDQGVKHPLAEKYFAGQDADGQYQPGLSECVLHVRSAFSDCLLSTASDTGNTHERSDIRNASAPRLQPQLRG